MFSFLRSLRTAAICLSLLSLTVIIGCQGPAAPDPSMTAVAGQGAGGQGSADWISAEEARLAESLGLDMRDSDLLLGEGNRIEDLFSPIYFEFDQSFIRPADRRVLQEVADYLVANPSAQLLVEGHCDWRGTTEYNMALGDRRATSVTSYLEQLGIPSDRLGTVSKGDLEATTEGSDEQMRRDRRADLIVIR